MTESDKTTPVVLIVDDDRSTRGLLNLAMSAEGYRVVEAKDGEQGLTEYKISQPDLVLMDAMMPGMDGFTCCQKLRKLPGGERLPLLILTVLDDQDSVDQAFASGATGYITKPIHWPVLSERVRRLLSSHQALLDAEAMCEHLQQQQQWTQLLSQTLQQHDQELWEQLQKCVNALQSMGLTQRVHLWQIESTQWVESRAVQPAILDPASLDLAVVPDWHRTLEQGKLLSLNMISNLGQNPVKLQLCDRFRVLQTESLLVLPLVVELRLWGMLYLHSLTRAWTDDELERLSDLKTILELILTKVQL